MATRKSRNKIRRRQAQPKPLSSKSAGGRRPFATHRHAVLATLALCLLVAASYFPATLAGFIWDDAGFTTAEPIQRGSGLWQIWFTPSVLPIEYESHYWPLLYTTFWLEHKLWGFAPLGYHIVNLLLHMAVTTLLWRLLLRLKVAGAWVAAAVFAVHPLHAESVAWVIGRKDILAALFSVACVLYYLRFIEDGRRGNYIRALLLYPAALLCKSVAVTLPVSLLIWHWWKQGRVTVADMTRVLPLLLLGLAITGADWAYYTTRDVASFDYSLLERALIAAHALGFYVGKLLWPTALAVIYPRWEVGVENPLAWGYAIGAVAVLALLWFYRHRIGRGPLAGALFFIVTLSPTLGFVDYGYMKVSFVADRYQYLAGIGVIAAIVGAAAHGLSGLSGTRRVDARLLAIALTAPLLAVLGTITWNQAGIYRDNVTFFSHIIAFNPEARKAHYNLGVSYEDQGRLEEALAAYADEYRFALKEQPADSTRILKALNDLGTMSVDLYRTEEAEAHYQRALRLDPHYLTTIVNLGALRIKQKRYREALELLQTFAKTNSSHAKIYSGIGVALAGLNRNAEALRSFDRALELDPNMEEARTNREHVRKNLQSGSK